MLFNKDHLTTYPQLSASFAENFAFPDEPLTGFGSMRSGANRAASNCFRHSPLAALMKEAATSSYTFDEIHTGARPFVPASSDHLTEWTPDSCVVAAIAQQMLGNCFIDRSPSHRMAVIRGQVYI